MSGELKNNQLGPFLRTLCVEDSVGYIHNIYCNLFCLQMKPQFFFTSMMCLISKTSDVATLHNFYVCYLFEELFVSNCSKPDTILGTVIEMKQKKKQKENNNKKISNLDELSCNGGKGGHSTQQQQICKIHNMLYKY